METRNCQNCKQDFTIEPDDFSFYEKIKVPPPTFCPECRIVRRMMWRNEHNLYHRKCVTRDGEKDLISNYSDSVPFPVYEQDHWWSDAWDPMDYAVDYDFSKTFFNQFSTLLNQVPVPHATNLQNSNSNYCNFTYQCKNCYLTFASDINEDSSYLHQSLRNKNSCDLEGCEGMESCVYGFKSKGCYESSHVYYSHNCINSNLMWDCYNCTNCYGCVSLRNKSNCIWNVQYSKEEYKEKIKEYMNGSHTTLKENLHKFLDFTLKFPRKYADILQSQNVTGNHIRGAKNCFNCFEVADKIEDCKFIAYAFGNTSQCVDMFAGGSNMEVGYEIMSVGENAQNVFLSAMAWGCSQVYYSIFCHYSTNLFGCVGLRNKQYCIFNKQYTKEEYNELVPKIIAHMNEMPFTDTKGIVYKYGEFFPSELSPFAYNETPAGDYYPLIKYEALAKGFRWKDKEKSNYSVTIKTEDVPDNIADIPDSIINEVIECEDKSKDYSPGAFRITASELQLYKKLNLPTPRKSPSARFYERLKHKDPYKLWHRACMCEKGNHTHAGKCENEFETAYAPERPEIIYCEKCYQQEVI
jgi:hypothetical protein